MPSSAAAAEYGREQNFAVVSVTRCAEGPVGRLRPPAPNLNHLTVAASHALAEDALQQMRLGQMRCGCQRHRTAVSSDAERAGVVQQRRAGELRRRHPLHSKAIFRVAGQDVDTGQKVRILVIGAGPIDTLATPCMQQPNRLPNARRFRWRLLRSTNATPIS